MLEFETRRVKAGSEDKAEVVDCENRCQCRKGHPPRRLCSLFGNALGSALCTRNRITASVLACTIHGNMDKGSATMPYDRLTVIRSPKERH